MHIFYFCLQSNTVKCDLIGGG